MNLSARERLKLYWNFILSYPAVQFIAAPTKDALQQIEQTIRPHNLVRLFLFKVKLRGK